MPSDYTPAKESSFFPVSLHHFLPPSPHYLPILSEWRDSRTGEESRDLFCPLGCLGSGIQQGRFLSCILFLGNLSTNLEYTRTHAQQSHHCPGATQAGPHLTKDPLGIWLLQFHFSAQLDLSIRLFRTPHSKLTLGMYLRNRIQYNIPNWLNSQTNTYSSGNILYSFIINDFTYMK